MKPKSNWLKGTLLVILGLAFVFVEMKQPHPVLEPQPADVCQMSSLQYDVWDSLSWNSTAKLAALPCDSKRRVLDLLADTQKDYRDEMLDRFFDQARSRQ